MNGRTLYGLLLAAWCTPALAEMSAEELAKLAQNPVGNLISVPFQNNTNFNVGPENGTQNILNIQPVIPISVNEDWNVITRTIMPLIWQPGFVAGQDTEFGLGDIQFNAFLSPAKPSAGGLIWGAGAIVQLPTNTNDRLGNDRWGLGPTAVVLHLGKGDPWVYGALVNNVWSVGSGDSPTYNNFLLQPFVNYNFPEGFYLTSPDYHGQLEGRQWRSLDRAARRRRRQDLPPWPPAGEHPAFRLLQHRHAGQRRGLATAGAGAAHVPEIEIIGH